MNKDIKSRVAAEIFSFEERDFTGVNWRTTKNQLAGYRHAGYDYDYRNPDPLGYECTIYNSNWRLTITGYTLLHEAVGMGNIDLIKFLFSHGANFDLLTHDGYSPLMIAVCFKQQRVVNCLLKYKADVNAKSHRPLVKNFMPKYNHSGIPDIPSQITPMMLAIENGDSKMIKILIENKAKVNTETIRHCLRVGQIDTVGLLFKSLPEDASFKFDEISGMPSLQFYLNNYSWTFTDALMDLITEYKARGYEVCKSNPSGQPVFQSFLRNSFGSKHPDGFNFIIKMDDINVNETYLEKPALSLFFSRDLMTGHHSCCSNKVPCCRYYVQWFVRECADFQLYRVQNFVYHQGHLDVLKLLYEAGAVFPADFRSSSMICTQSCKIHKKYNVELKDRRQNELDSFCEMIENNPKSLFSLARVAVRKLPNVQHIIDPNSPFGSVFRDRITFKAECEEMMQQSFENHFECCSMDDNESD